MHMRVCACVGVCSDNCSCHSLAVMRTKLCATMLTRTLSTVSRHVLALAHQNICICSASTLIVDLLSVFAHTRITLSCRSSCFFTDTQKYRHTCTCHNYKRSACCPFMFPPLLPALYCVYSFTRTRAHIHIHAQRICTRAHTHTENMHVVTCT